MRGRKLTVVTLLASVQPYIGPEPALPITRNAVQGAIRQWANKEAVCLCRWQNTNSCRPAKTMITEYNSGRTRELLRLPRHMLRLVTGIFTGHAKLNRHLNIIGIIDDPICNKICEEGPETATHFLCECSRYAAFRHDSWE